MGKLEDIWKVSKHLVEGGEVTPEEDLQSISKDKKVAKADRMLALLLEEQKKKIENRCENLSVTISEEKEEKEENITEEEKLKKKKEKEQEEERKRKAREANSHIQTNTKQNNVNNTKNTKKIAQKNPSITKSNTVETTKVKEKERDNR